MGCLTSNKSRLFVIGCLGLGIGAYMAMGCGSSGSSGSSSGTSTASTDSLKSVPTADVSAVDPTATTTSSSDASLPESSSSKSIKAVSAAKGFGSTFREEGGSSRAHCEQKMQKDQIEGMALHMQMPRCAFEAMEEAGAFKVPATGAVIVEIIPPEIKADERNKMCANIPAEDIDAIAACKSGTEGSNGQKIVAKISRENGLQIDICEGGTHNTELTYTQATADSFNLSGIRKARFMGKDESFSLSGDVTGIASISEGIPTLNSTGKYQVTGKMIAGPGSGVTTLTFEDDSYSLKSAFKVSSTDIFTKKANSFTAKGFAIVDVVTTGGVASVVGCAKYSMTGSESPIKPITMVPHDIPADQQEGFYKQFGSQLGVALNGSNADTVLFCSNPNFEPTNTSDAVKPLVQMTGTTCPEVTRTGVECFRETISSEKNDFGGKKFHRSAVVVAKSLSKRFDEVNAFDLATLSADTGAIDFARSFDCTGVTETIDFTKLSPSVAIKVGRAIQKCMALDERARDNGGMGDYSCHSQDNQKFGREIEKKAQDGTLTGMVDGEYSRGSQGENSCIPQGLSMNAAPEKIYVNPININQKKYCIPLPNSGACGEFTVDSSTVSGLSLTVPSPRTENTVKVTQIVYGAGTGVTTRANSAIVSFRIISPGLSDMLCSESYTLAKQEFVPRPATEKVVSEVCKAKGITEFQPCIEFCGRRENKGCH